MHCFPSAQPFKPCEKNREQDKTNHFSGCIVHPASLISCKYVCEQYVFGLYVSVVYLKLAHLLLFLLGTTLFQQDEKGVIDLAGGWMAGSMLAHFSFRVCLCERHFTQTPVCVRE